MGKIILSLGDKQLREIPLSKERVTIGRRPHNHIVIDDLAISGEHAVIVTTNQDSFLEDLNSTNGTQVNGQPVKRHYLRDQDCIELAQYRLHYFAEQFVPSGRRNAFAKVTVLNGARTGSETVLTKAITTVGKQDLQTAVILLRPDGYYLAHVEGAQYPLVNGLAIGAKPQKLKEGDVIELAGDSIQFSRE